MAAIDLRLRNLDTAELLIASFEREEDAEAWLAERPSGMEVLGVIARSDDPELHHRLRAAARPLDADEAAVVARLDAEAERAYAARRADEARRAEAERAAYLASLRTADPKRPMLVTWSLAGGFERGEPADEREINADVREAILAWVRERDTWVADRGQVVAEATVTVWPLEVPAGEERVQRGGQFRPAPAPKPV